MLASLRWSSSISRTVTRRRIQTALVTHDPSETSAAQGCCCAAPVIDLCVAAAVGKGEAVDAVKGFRLAKSWMTALGLPPMIVAEAVKPERTILARLHAKPEKRDELLVLYGFVDQSRKEPGCVDYHLHVSDADPNVFMFYENWRTAKELREHQKSRGGRTVLAPAP